jgi:hypothetical protein
MASRKKAPKKVCIPVAQAKKLGIATKARKGMKQVLRSDRGKKYLKAKKAFEQEARSALNTTCSLVSSAANKFQSHAESLAEVAKGAGEITPKQASAIVAAGRKAEKRARVVCNTISKHEKAVAKRDRAVSALSGRRRRR